MHIHKFYKVGDRCRRFMWMKTIQQDLKAKSNNLSLNEAIAVAQNRPL